MCVLWISGEADPICHLCRAPPNSWLCGPGVIRRFAPPLTPMRGTVASAWVFGAALRTSGGWAPEAGKGLDIQQTHIYRGGGGKVSADVWPLKLGSVALDPTAINVHHTSPSSPSNKR